MVETVDLTGSVSKSDETDICPNNPPTGDWCLSGGGNITIGGGVSVTLLNIPKQYLNGTGIISGTAGVNFARCYKDADNSYDADKSFVKLCIKSVDITGSVTTILGLSLSISGQLYAGNCN